MINYQLPSGEKRCIDNKFNIGDSVKLFFNKNEVNAIILKIAVTFTGVYYYTDYSNDLIHEESIHL